MPRTARVKSRNKIYHIMIRGINQQNIFADDEDDAYFLTVLRYIHQNPLKAGLVDNIDSCKWSSYQEYISKTKIVNVDFVLVE